MVRKTRAKNQQNSHLAKLFQLSECERFQKNAVNLGLVKYILPRQALRLPPVVVMLSQASVVHVMVVVNSFCFLGHLFEVFQSGESCEARRLTKTKKTCATL